MRKVGYDYELNQSEEPGAKSIVRYIKFISKIFANKIPRIIIAKLETVLIL